MLPIDMDFITIKNAILELRKHGDNIYIVMRKSAEQTLIDMGTVLERDELSNDVTLMGHEVSVFDDIMYDIINPNTHFIATVSESYYNTMCSVLSGSMLDNVVKISLKEELKMEILNNSDERRLKELENKSKESYELYEKEYKKVLIKKQIKLLRDLADTFESEFNKNGDISNLRSKFSMKKHGHQAGDILEITTAPLLKFVDERKADVDFIVDSRYKLSGMVR